MKIASAESEQQWASSRAPAQRRGEEEIGKLVKFANTDESNFVKRVNSLKRRREICEETFIIFWSEGVKLRAAKLTSSWSDQACGWRKKHMWLTPTPTLVCWVLTSDIAFERWLPQEEVHLTLVCVVWRGGSERWSVSDRQAIGKVTNGLTDTTDSR